MLPKVCYISKAQREENKANSLSNKVSHPVVPIPNITELGKRKQKDTDTKYQLGMTKEEIDKQKYLQAKHKPREIIRHTDKSRTVFKFDWDASEDTSKDISPLYISKADPKLLFGRGSYGGVYNNRENYDFVKDGEHWSKKNLSDLTERDYRIMREDLDIVVRAGKVPPPIRSWEEAEIPSNLRDSIINAHKHKKPMQIQYQAIPIGLSRQDMIATAPTGSGKTLAFLIPLITYLDSLPPMNDDISENGPRAIILSPTRELAQQIGEEFNILCNSTIELRCSVIVGGKSEEDQSISICRGTDVIIGTPGRILDCIAKRILVLNQADYVILDEADKMIDMGLEEPVKKILDCIPSTHSTTHIRITHLFSATFPTPLEALAKSITQNPAIICIGKPGSGVKDITQKVVMVSQETKRANLIKLLNDSTPPIIVFLNQKKDADSVRNIIESMGHLKCATLHSNKTQEKRESALSGFKDGRFDVLVCTNLGSRGLDIDGITHVINYDAPNNIMDYIHRIGRTARAGKSGRATTMLTNSDSTLFYDLKNFLFESGQTVPQELLDHPASKVKIGETQFSQKSKSTVYTN